MWWRLSSASKAATAGAMRRQASYSRLPFHAPLDRADIEVDLRPPQADELGAASHPVAGERIGERKVERKRIEAARTPLATRRARSVSRSSAAA